jgi:predicted nucleic acid-binding protein
MPSEKHRRGSNAGRDVVLDTCCLVNLAAIDGTLDCLESFELIWYVPTAVQTEGVFIRAAADSREVQRIHLEASITKGVVQICSPTDDVENTLYVELALSLGDGEAMALAIAKNRGWKVATDDRKARNKADAVGVSVVTTPELVKRWASDTARSSSEVAMALRRIETLARFSPAENSPAAKWWRDLLNENPGA